MRIFVLACIVCLLAAFGARRDEPSVRSRDPSKIEAPVVSTAVVSRLDDDRPIDLAVIVEVAAFAFDRMHATIDRTEATVVARQQAAPRVTARGPPA